MCPAIVCGMQTVNPIDAAREALLADIADFMAERQIAETTFGLLAVKDGKFVSRLRSGKNMTTEVIARAHAFIQAERSKAAA